jgi:2-dehydropantoate 2-reductase
MRIIVYGAGAVGSVIGGRAAQASANVVLVARQAHVDAINANGLLIRTGEGEDRITIPAVTSLDELEPETDDVVIITAKTQDTPPIHAALRNWNPSVAVVCGTNGVEHERMALRNFPAVYGMVIQLPATFEQPGEVTALCMPTNAIIDIGRYPNGVDDLATQIAEIFAGAPHVLCEVDPNVMVKKQAKILLNLGNAAEAACGLGGRGTNIVKIAQEEAKRAYDAAGIEFRQLDQAREAAYNDRIGSMKFVIPEGTTFLGGSTWQSLAKGATSLETDYFNGEIVLLGRLHNVPTPANEFLQNLATSLLHQGAQPGSWTVEQLDAATEKLQSGKP